MQRTSTSGVARLLLVAASMLQVACAGPRVIGQIPSSTFQFHNVVPYSSPRQGGWKVAQVLVLLGRISPIFPETASCDLEVGVPEINLDGRVTDELAQRVAASSADASAREVFNKRLVTGALCTEFRQRMQFHMNNTDKGPFIAGVRVSKFKPWGIPLEPRTFP